MKISHQSYQPIENYGLIGDMHSLAMVSLQGSIDWFCFPYFDSPSVFGRLLDNTKGGHFSIRPYVDEVSRKQLYHPETNVLISRFFCKHGVGEVTDFMPIYEEPLRTTRTIIRKVQAVKGEVKFRMECLPSFNYGIDVHETILSNEGVSFSSDNYNLNLTSPYPLQIYKKGVALEFDLRQGEECIFVLRAFTDEALVSPWVTEVEANKSFVDTVKYWRKWISKSTYHGRWREMVDRSAFVLKLLTFEPTGAIISAGTTSLPEGVGGVRNWDYRYTYLRDAAFTVRAFLKLGFKDEAASFMKWLENRCKELDDNKVLYGVYSIDGRSQLEETQLTHLKGYKDSAPVRIGYDSLKGSFLDIFGPILDAAYLCNKYATPVSDEFWRYLLKLANWVSENWNTKDKGIWQLNGHTDHFVHSKLMCWVAIDRALKLAEDRSFPVDKDKLILIKDEIFQEIWNNGWNEEIESFVQTFGSDNLDASNLMMTLTDFLSPTDPRIIKTIDASMKDPFDGGLFSNNLVYRYNIEETDDGLPGEEGTYNICTFWLVESLSRASRSNPRYLEDARMIFEKMLGFANHLGIYSEQIGTHGESLGNFPQALTHLGLISAACNLNDSLGKRNKK